MQTDIPLHTIAAVIAMVFVCKLDKVWKMGETAAKVMDGAPRFPARVTPGKCAASKNWKGPTYDPLVKFLFWVYLTAHARDT